MRRSRVTPRLVASTTPRRNGRGGPMSADMGAKLATWRRRSTLIALALTMAVPATVALPSAHARAMCAGISDPAGDVSQETPCAGGNAPARTLSSNPGVGLEAGSAQRSAGAFTVVFRVAELTADPSTGDPLGTWNLAFRAGAHRYEIHAGGFNAVVNAGHYRGWFGFHALRDGHALAGVTGAFDPARGTVAVRVPSVDPGPVLRSVAADTVAVMAYSDPAEVRQVDEAATPVLRLVSC